MYHRCSAGTAETRGRGVPPSPFPLIFPRKKLGCGHCARKIIPRWVKVDRYFHRALFLQYCTIFPAKSDFCDRNLALRGQKTTNFCSRRSQFLSGKSQKCEKRMQYCKNRTVNIRFSVLSRNVRVSRGKHRNPGFFPGKMRPSWWRFTSNPPPFRRYPHGAQAPGAPGAPLKPNDFGGSRCWVKMKENHRLK